MSHSSGSSGYSGGHQGDGGGNFHYAVGDNYNPLGTYSDIYNLEHLSEGLRINNGIRFAILFIAFAGWLYVVYWLRHHEPLSKQSIGVSVSTNVTPTTNQDKSIVAAIRNAFPFKTSPDFGKLYAPSPQPIVSNAPVSCQINKPLESKTKSSPSSNSSNAGGAISAPITYVDSDFDQRFGSPTSTQLTPPPSTVSEPILSDSAKPNNLPPQANTNTLPPQTNTNQPYIDSYSSYGVLIKNGNNSSLRTIVNR